MNNATVTLQYVDFQAIKEKADKLEKLEAVRDDLESTKEDILISNIAEILEKGAYCKGEEYKQWYLVQALKEIYTSLDTTLEREFEDLQYGAEPAV